MLELIFFPKKWLQSLYTFTTFAFAILDHLVLCHQWQHYQCCSFSINIFLCQQWQHRHQCFVVVKLFIYHQWQHNQCYYYAINILLCQQWQHDHYFFVVGMLFLCHQWQHISNMVWSQILGSFTNVDLWLFWIVWLALNFYNFTRFVSYFYLGINTYFLIQVVPEKFINQKGPGKISKIKVLAFPWN